jgi:hypothetical protein
MQASIKLKYEAQSSTCDVLIPPPSIFGLFTVSPLQWALPVAPKCNIFPLPPKCNIFVARAGVKIGSIIALAAAESA